MGQEVTRKFHLWAGALCFLMMLGVTHAQTETGGIALNRYGATVRLEAYAPNIVRVTMSLDRAETLRAPGPGITGGANNAGWQHSQGRDGEDRFSSAALSVEVSPENNQPLTGTRADIERFFKHKPSAPITFRDGHGTVLLQLQAWQMSVPNDKDGTAGVLKDRRPSDPAFYEVGATFRAPADEHYYGLGQNQEGFLDLRGHAMHCEHDYRAAGGPSVCVPFVVTNKHYAVLWDNPSRAKVNFAFNEQTKWTSQVGRRVSFFVIAGDTYDDFYRGYRLLTGDTPMLPKSAYGFIQSKQRYTTQHELLEVAHGYRDRKLPADMLVVDWLYYTKMGQMEMDPAQWPDPAAMNRELHGLNFHTMISVWPRFAKGSRYYDTVLKHGWFEHLADGQPTSGEPYDLAGSDIDTTNPEAAKWYWGVIRDNLVVQGFDSFWADETEPDLPLGGNYIFLGPGTEYFNAYPYFHTKAFYDGFRSDTKTRALILSRDAYTGAQHNGAIFWSSDIYPTWDTLTRQISTGINFTASGMPYWGTDIGGWQYLPPVHVPDHPPLINPATARGNVGGYDDYPELYVRWFEYGVFQPNFRTHGSRPQNEVWSYGTEAEPILEKYLRLRYALLPYIYSIAHATHESGAPFMRGLFMDFPGDPLVANLGDEYMFGPTLLVAPVTTQGATSRFVYLPAGADWYNYWTNEHFTGGQKVNVAAPVDTIPLFVRAGSILPVGAPILSTNEQQSISEVRAYVGADASFDLYSDDGSTYAYESGDFQVKHLRWSDAVSKMSQDGGSAKVTIIGR